MGENQDLQASYGDITKRDGTQAAGVFGSPRHDTRRIPDLRRDRGLLRPRHPDSWVSQVQRADSDAVQFRRDATADELGGALSTRGGETHGRRRLRVVERRALAGRHGQSLRGFAVCPRACNAGVACYQPFPVHALVLFAPARHPVGAETLRGQRSAAQTSAWRHRLTNSNSHQESASGKLQEVDSI